MNRAGDMYPRLMDAASESASRVLMIAYDGSPNADRAIAYAGRFLRADLTHVVTAWRPGGVAPTGISALAGGVQPYLDPQMDAEVDAALRDEATEVNVRGVGLATEAGLTAKGSLAEVESTVWGALVAAADALDVDMLVTGTRGETGLRALVHSSVAEHVLKHCGRPVFIVPACCDRQPDVTP